MPQVRFMVPLGVRVIRSEKGKKIIAAQIIFTSISRNLLVEPLPLTENALCDFDAEEFGLSMLTPLPI